MDYLLTCPCGHPIDRHQLDGPCGGVRRRRCACTRAPYEAIDAAIEEVRTREWPSRPPMSFETFVTTLFDRIRARVPDAVLRCEHAQATFCWHGGSLEAQPAGKDRCKVRGHSEQLHASAQAQFTLSEEGTRVAAEFALLLRGAA